MRRLAMVGFASVLAIISAGCSQTEATPITGIDSKPSPAVSPTATTTPAPATVPTATLTLLATADPVPTATPAPLPPVTPVTTAASTPAPEAMTVPTAKPTIVPIVTPASTTTPTTVPTPTSGPFNPAVAIPPPDGLAHWWPGDGHAGDIALGNHGALRNGVAFTTGKVGQAFNFDGTAFVEIANTNSLEPSTITAEVWVKKLGSPGSLRYILSKGANGCFIASYAMYTGRTGGLSFYISDGLNFRASPDAGTGIWDGSWHHVAGTFDGSAVRLYVDGVEVGSGNPTSLSIGYGLPTNEGFYIGDYRGTCDSPFKGAIDEVSIYSRALSDSEIRAVFNTGSAGKIKPQITLIPTPTPKPAPTAAPAPAGIPTPANTGTSTPAPIATPVPLTIKEVEALARAGLLVRADLHGLDLSGANLPSADLYQANLSSTLLSGANLQGAILQRADLTGADLTGADLRFANLTGTNLTGANLFGADLTSAMLRVANLSGADLSEAILLNAKFYDTNFTGTNLAKTDWENAHCRVLANNLNFLCTLEELKAAGASVAVAPPPAKFSGMVFLDTIPVAEGTTVTAIIGGKEVASTKVDVGSIYSFRIHQPPNVVFASQKIKFTVGGFTAETTATWESGKETVLILIAFKL